MSKFLTRSERGSLIRSFELLLILSGAGGGKIQTLILAAWLASLILAQV